MGHITVQGMHRLLIYWLFIANHDIKIKRKRDKLGTDRSTTNDINSDIKKLTSSLSDPKISVAQLKRKNKSPKSILLSF